MIKFILTTIFTVFTIFSFGQISEISILVTDEKTEAPLPKASIYFEGLNKGGVTNFDGVATFTDIPSGEQRIRVSYVSYKTIEKTINVGAIKTFTVELEAKGSELNKVVIQSTRSTRTVKKIPTRIEFIGAEELGEKVVMNPTNISMVLRESTGIQMQQTSLNSGNTNIRIQGLDGRYTQLLRDGFPLYGGFSSGLSILQIPPLDLKQFEIIKGSSSTLYGGGAIAGLVNMVSKTPDKEPELDIMFTQTQALGSTANVFYSKRNEKVGVSLYGSGHYQKEYDPEGDGFSNLPLTKSISFNPKVFYYPSENTTFWIGLNGTYDDRTGGDIKAINNGASGANTFSESNISKRLSSQAVYNTQLDSGRSFSIKNSVSFFDRDLTLPSIFFRGKQVNTFTELSYNAERTNSEWVLGANLYTTNFNEDDASPLQRDQSDMTIGLFANNIYDISDKWILETGLRTDYAKDWGFFPLPRVSLLYKPNNGFSSRIGGGLGYKIPDIFTEEAEFINYNNILAINKNTLKAERSYGVNLDLNYQKLFFDKVGFSINQLFYLTAIQNGLLLTPTNGGFANYINASGAILSKGAETNIKFTYKDFRWFLNYALIDTRLQYLQGKPQKPLTARHNVGSVLMYESEKWRLGYETYYTGQQVLFDGSKSTDFITMGLMAMRNFKWGTTFMNFENFTDRRQSRYSPLVLAPTNNPTFPEIYAPTDGFIFSIGVIIKPFGNEDEDND